MKKAINVALAALFMVGTVNIAMAECNTEGNPITHMPGRCVSLIIIQGEVIHNYCDTTVAPADNDCWKFIDRT